MCCGANIDGMKPYTYVSSSLPFPSLLLPFCFRFVLAGGDTDDNDRCAGLVTHDVGMFQNQTQEDHSATAAALQLNLSRAKEWS